MKKTVIGTCPVCASKLKVARLHCHSCSTSIEGDFELDKFSYLTKEQKLFIEVFVKNRGNIKEISNGPTISKGTVSYKSYIYIKNDHLLLKPGMTVHANIIVAQRKNVFAVPGYVFSINPKLIKAVAKEKEYGYKPATPKKIEMFKKNMKNKENIVKTNEYLIFSFSS